MSSTGHSPGTLFSTVPVEEASKLVAAGARTYLDVRTPEEFSTGHVEGAVNIPYMVNSAQGRVPAEDFLQSVQARFSPGAHLLIGCKSGVRSQRAAKDLVRAGFCNVVNIDGGITAWVSKGLPLSE